MTEALERIGTIETYTATVGTAEGGVRHVRVYEAHVPGSCPRCGTQTVQVGCSLASEDEARDHAAKAGRCLACVIAERRRGDTGGDEPGGVLEQSPDPTPIAPPALEASIATVSSSRRAARAPSGMLFSPAPGCGGEP